MITLNLKFDQSLRPFGQAQVEKVISALDKKLKPEDIVIGVRITTAEQVRYFNKKYAGKDEFTDVLSFNYAEGALAPYQEKAGDIVISNQHVQDQAKQAKTSAETELALLTLHGVLHILGYDHQTKQQQAKVDELQASVMRAAGLTYRNFAWQD